MAFENGSTRMASQPSLAKITRPRISGVFPRKRLFELLDVLSEYPITWVSAPGGSGKTTLAASYLAEKKSPCLWYDIDEGDDDIASFFYYMGLAMRKAAPRKKALPLLTPEYLQSIPIFTLRYFEKLYSGLEPPFTLVFDNCQQVADSSQFHRVLADGLSVLPERIRVILLSRQQINSRYARLRANDKIRVLGAHEIDFTFDESKNMVALKGLKGFPDEFVHQLHERTRGWAAGLVLMLETARVARVEDAQHPDGFTSQEVFDYFTQEIFEQASSETQEFLLKTAFFSKMTASMAQQLTGITRSREILTSLCRNNFFTQRDAQPDPFFRYHPLFREFLLSEGLNRIGAAETRDIKQAAAVVLEASGEIEDAAALLLSSESWDEMERFVCVHAPGLIAQGRSKTLEAWLTVYPKAIADQSAWLLYWMGVCFLTRQARESYALFEKAFRLFGSRNDTAGQFLAWSGAVDSIIFGWDDFRPLGFWIKWLKKRFRSGMVFPSVEVEARVLASLTRTLLWGPFPPESKWVERALQVTRETRDVDLRLSVLTNSVLYYVSMGDFLRAIELVEQSRNIVSSPKASPLARLLWKCYGESVGKSTRPGSYGECIQVIDEALAIAQENGLHLFDNQLLVHRIMACYNAADMKEATLHLRKLGTTSAQGSLQAVGQYEWLTAWHHYLKGNMPQAYSIVTRLVRMTIEQEMAYQCILCRDLLIQVLWAQGFRDEAFDELETQKKRIRTLTDSHFAFLCLLHEARFNFDTGNIPPAVKALERAMMLGRKRDYKTLEFYWQPRQLARLCAKALEYHVEVEYVRELISCLNLVNDAEPALEDWPWQVKVYVLGKFEVYRNDVPVKLQKKPALLLKALIATGAKEIREDNITDLLWPDSEGDAAHSAFTTVLSRLRHSLGEETAILFKDGAASINRGCCWIDAFALTDIAQKTEKLVPEQAAGLADKAGQLYAGPFLAGDAEHWIMPTRNRIRERFLASMRNAGEALRKAGRWEKAAECYQRALDVDDLSEELYRSLMVCYREQGDPGKAVTVYEHCKRVLRTTFGIEPSPKTRELYKTLVSGSPVAEDRLR